jgi:hypothetical protein
MADDQDREIGWAVISAVMMQLLAAGAAALMHCEIFIKQCTFAATRATPAPSVQKGGF